jgi:hypothetical protein
VKAAKAPADSVPAGAGKAARPPLNPYFVLLIAILLPGFGHVVSGQTRRGFTMQLFMIALAFVTWQLAPPGTSLAGKLSGGLFVYALSIPEAYRIAKLRWEAFQTAQSTTPKVGTSRPASA